jgi:hypothetical protein
MACLDVSINAALLDENKLVAILGALFAPSSWMCIIRLHACGQPMYPEALGGVTCSFPARHVHDPCCTCHSEASQVRAQNAACVTKCCSPLRSHSPEALFSGCCAHSCTFLCQLTCSVSMQARFRQRRGPCRVRCVLLVRTKIRAIAA